MVKTLISAYPGIAPIIYTLVKKAIEEDQNHWYGNMFIVDYGIIKTGHFKAFDYEDQFLVVERIDDEHSHWYIKNFDAKMKIWDGTTFLPDRGCISLDALLKASLFHDVLYARMEKISERTGVSAHQLQAFSDDMLKILADGYGAKKAITSPIHQIVRFFGSLYHRTKKYFSSIVLMIAFFVLLSVCLSGCYSMKTEMESKPPEVHFDGPFFYGSSKE